MKTLIIMRRLAVLGLATALALLVSGFPATAGHSASKAASPHYTSPHMVLDVTIVVRSDAEQGKKGPDGKWHDAFLPGNFTVLAGVPVRVTIYNYDEGPHSFTSTALHLHKIVAKGSANAPSKTTFTFTPKKTGTFQWRCMPGCDPWAMAHNGYMRGFVKVVG